MGKVPLPHNKINCYPPYPDHYLNASVKHDIQTYRNPFYSNTSHQLLLSLFRHLFLPVAFFRWACTTRSCSPILGSVVFIEIEKKIRAEGSYCMYQSYFRFLFRLAGNLNNLDCLNPKKVWLKGMRLK